MVTKVLHMYLCRYLPREEGRLPSFNGFFTTRASRQMDKCGAKAN